LPQSSLKTMKKNNMIKLTKKKETMTIKPISKNNVILKKGDECTFSTFTNDYPNLHLNQKITIADVYDNGVVCVDNGTNIQVNVLANQIDKD
jgi:predicted ribosome-associated RNA-binding protein Tma20